MRDAVPLPNGIPKLTGIGSLMQDNNNLFKKGAATGATAGVFSHMKSQVFLERDGDSAEVGTIEYCVIGFGSAVSQRPESINIQYRQANFHTLAARKYQIWVLWRFWVSSLE